MRLTIAGFLILILVLFVSIDQACAQYGYNMPGIYSRNYSMNGFRGSTPYYPSNVYQMQNRYQTGRGGYGGGYYPSQQIPHSSLPYTVHLDQYRHVEYNKPGRVGYPTYINYYNAGPHPKNRAWSR